MNRPMISAGAARDATLPEQRLSEPELQELHQLLAAHGAAREQVAVLEQRLSLLILTARDRRGLAGRIQVDPESGNIVLEGGENAG